MKNKSFPTLAKEVQIIFDEHAAEANNMAIFETLCAVLAKFEGKQVTQRFVTALQAHFGQDAYCVIQNQHIGIPSISLYGPKVPGHHTYETRFHFFLPCHSKSHQPFTVANLREANVCYCEAAKKRNYRRANVTEASVRRAAIAIDNFIAARSELQDALVVLEDRHDIYRAFGISNE